MTFTWYGGTCLKAQFGETVIAVDPDGAVGAAPRFRAGIVLSTVPKAPGPKTSGSRTDAGFEISGPGEYELNDVVIRGFDVRNEATNERDPSMSTVYLMDIEGMRVVFLGQLSGADVIQGDVADEFGSVDILAVSVGPGSLGVADAAVLIREIEPRIAIVMPADLSSGRASRELVESVAKRAGGGPMEDLPKLTIRRSALDPEAGTRIAYLRPSGT